MTGRTEVPALAATRATLLLLAALLAACSRKSAPLRFPEAPVVLISIDTLRSDHLPAYGYRGVETPHLDRFRKDAILFRDAWSPCPMTLPSHVTMLTGKNPPAHGVRTNLGFTFRSESHPSLPTLLRARGYATGAAVSSYVLRGETGLAGAFEWYEDSIHPQPGAAFADYQRSGTETSAAARAWMAARGTAPFFLFLHLYEPHVPYDPPAAFRARAVHPYDGEIAAADAIVGEVLDALRASGVYDRAIVAVTSDHGEGLGDHGEEQHSILLYREALQVPLLVKLPGSRRGGDTVAAPVQLADLLPTLTDLLGLERPPALDGRSLLDPLPPERPLYGETLYPRIQLGWGDLRSMADGRYHLIEGPRPELYDYVADPGERHDLLASSAAAAQRLRSALRQVPEGDRAPAEVAPEVAERLAALGYAGTPRAAPAQPLANPRDQVPLLGRIRDGLRLAQEGRFDEAQRVLERLANENPAMVEAWMKLGEVRSRAGRHAAAAAAFRQAVARCDPPGADMLLALGQAELAAGGLAEAEKAARAAEAGSPTHARVLLAEVLVRRGDHGAALRALEGAPPAVFKVEFVRADALARLGRPAEAEAAYRRHIAAFPAHLQSYANLAVLAFVQGRRGEVDAILEQMAGAAPGAEAYRVAEKTMAAFGDQRAAAAWRRRGS